MTSDADAVDEPDEPVEDVACSDCGAETFTIKRVDEWVTLADSFAVFCEDCGALLGKFAEFGPGGRQL